MSPIISVCPSSGGQAYRKAGTGRPCAVSGHGDDGGFVEVAGANQTDSVVRS
jgi:hypothetical protein